MKKNNYSRRKFISALSAGSVAAAVYSPGLAAPFIMKKEATKLAALGGRPVRPDQIGPDWPYLDERVVNSVLETTKSRVWSRIQSADGKVATFEPAFAELIGAAHCVGTGSGTQALSTCVEALGIGPGDEVITSPYTDMGTISAILTSRALPVMADLDPESFQLDPDEVERLVNENTKAIMPVHIMGLPADMGRIMAIARKHDLKVIEDACQAPLARYRGQPLGLIGNLGCFSFQASKAIPCGEGGAVVGDDQALMEQCYTVHNRGASRAGKNETIGPKYRMNEFEGAILMGQLPGVKERFLLREENARYLDRKFSEIPGIKVQKKYEGTESGAYYRYALSYVKEEFNGADRSLFLKAIAAEGIPFGSYIRNGLHREPWTNHILGLKGYRSMFSKARLNDYRENLNLPNCDKVTDETHISLWGSGILLGSKTDMDAIVNAVEKVYQNRDQLKDL